MGNSCPLAVLLSHRRYNGDLDSRARGASAVRGDTGDISVTEHDERTDKSCELNLGQITHDRLLVS